MKKEILIAAIIVFVAISGLYVYNSQRHPAESISYKAQILSKLGSLDCYTYQEDVKVIRGNTSIESTLEGGYFNGTYFFHGKRDHIEWWTVLKGRTMIQRILVNGSEKIVDVNVSDEEYALMTSYDPVRFAVRAVGVGMEIGSEKDSRTYRYTVRLFPSDNAPLITGNITVRADKTFVPVEIHIVGNVVKQDGNSEFRDINAKIDTRCQVPQWVLELLKQGG